MFGAARELWDSHRETEVKEERQALFFQKCREDFAAAAADLHGSIIGISEGANPCDIPAEILDGSAMLPVYAFKKVLEVQGGCPTLEQDELLDLFFSRIDPEFTKYEFLASLSSNNRVSQRMGALVGISDSFAGEFWVTLFKAINVTNGDEKVLSKITVPFSTLVICFAILGKLQSQFGVSICEDFVNAVYKQIIKCRSLPESGVDWFGEVHYLEHKKRMENIATALFTAAGEQDEIDIREKLDYFFVTILYDLVNSSTMTVPDKARILDEAFHKCSINPGFSGHEVFRQMEDRTALYDLICDLRDTLFVLILYWSVTTESKTGVVEFGLECFGFLGGVERELVKAYPHSGFGQFSRQYVIDRLSFSTNWSREKWSK